MVCITSHFIKAYNLNYCKFPQKCGRKNFEITTVHSLRLNYCPSAHWTVAFWGEFCKMMFSCLAAKLQGWSSSPNQVGTAVRKGITITFFIIAVLPEGRLLRGRNKGAVDKKPAQVRKSKEGVCQGPGRWRKVSPVSTKPKASPLQSKGVPSEKSTVRHSEWVITHGSYA